MMAGHTLPDRSQGTVLFADISGFTPLTDALVKKLGHVRGAEELTAQLNRVYSRLVDEVHRYRGSVISFSGDAITCWFDATEGQHQPEARAVTCALQMQAAMQSLNANTQETLSHIPRLEIKIGIVSGQVRRFAVGEPTVQLIDTLAGSLMDDVATAEGLAQRGDIIVHANVVEQLKPDLVVKEWRPADRGQRFATVQAFAQQISEEPWPEIAPSAIPDETLKPWILPTIYDHLQSGTTHFLGELRSAVSLFLKFSGLEYDQDENARQKLDRLVRWVQTVLSRYEGTLLQLTIGDKGSYLHATFGAPVAHEDDADRAVMAALALRTPPPELAYIESIQIGITQGRMRVGTYGSQKRQVYGTLGDEVNVAARLMVQAAPGQIIVSERIAQGVNRPFRFQPLGHIKVKGKGEPLPVYELAEGISAVDKISLNVAGPAWAYITTTVGRQTEKAVLTDKLTALQNGAGGVLLIEGEPGIGKSHLALKLFQQAQASGVQVLMGEADAIDCSTPYYAWRPIFRQLFGLAELPENSETWREQVRQQLQDEPDFLDRLALLNVILPLDFAETEKTAQMTSQVRGDNTNTLLLAVLKKYLSNNVAQPHLLIFEDAQWLDSASWTLLMLAQRSLPGLLLVLTTRPFSDITPPEYTQLRHLPDCHHLLLDTLTQAEIIQLVCQRLAVDSLPEPVSQLIINKAEGHPFFSEELAYALRDAGLIVVENGRCRLTDQAHNLEHLDFPDTIEGIITSRIDRLSPSQQLVLKVASVIGRIFTMRILGAVHPVDTLRHKLIHDLITLEKLDITPLESPEPDLSYYFKHIITRDVSYNLMTYAQRGQLHATVANWYENQYQEDLSPFYALLAHHWYKALETSSTDSDLLYKAIDYHEQAGDQTLRNGVYREATYFFETTLDLAKNLTDIPDRRRAYWLRQLGEAQLGMGHIADGRHSLAQALAALGYRVPITKSRLVRHTLKELARQVIHRWRQLHNSVSAQDSFITPAGSRPTTEAVTTNGFVVPTGSRQPAKAGMTNRWDPTDERERLLEIARTFELYGEASYLMGDIVALVHAMFSALNVAEKTGPSRESALANAYLVGIVGLFKRPQWVQGYRHRALTTAQMSNHLPTIGRVLHIISVGGVGDGNWKQIKEDIGQAIDIYQHLGDRRQLGESLTVLILVRNYQSQFKESIILCERLLTLARQSDNALQQMWAYDLQAMNLLQLGQTEAAQATLDEVTKLPVNNPEANYRGLQTLTHFRLGRLAEARRCADEALAQMTQTSVLQISMLNAYSALAEVYLALWAQTADKSEQAALHDLAGQACKQLNVYGSRFNSGIARAALWQGVFEWHRNRKAQAFKQWQKSLLHGRQYGMPYDTALAHYYLSQHLEPVAAQKHRDQAQAIFREIGAKYRLEQIGER
jgi:class 3 adenylate cyclase/tetratricopeptide (TPR) repeat protein